MPLAEAQALVPGLAIAEADPAGDAAALARLAVWCLRYTPLTAPDPPDGVWLDITGCAHLAGGETALLEELIARLARAGIAARAGLADTPGAAHALARFAADPLAIAAPGRSAESLAPLPVAALRLDEDSTALLRRLGLETIGALLAAPRAPFTRRFGPALLRRLDQALGRAPEPLAPATPPEAPQHRLAFAEPLLTAEALAAAIGTLAGTVCARLDRTGQGALRLDLIIERVDGSVQALRVGTASPTRDPGHLARLLRERLERVDPGFGVEAMRLVVSLAAALPAEQQRAPLHGEAPAPDLAPLIDRLQNRFGAGHVYAVEELESDLPERSLRHVLPPSPRPSPPPGAERVRGIWGKYPRPSRLFSHPQPIQALAVLPDHPPAAFIWRHVRHRVRRADGPERITGEWWRADNEAEAVRDYWAVEDETGRRFWLFRSGDAADPATGDLSWYLHGLF